MSNRTCTQLQYPFDASYLVRYKKKIKREIIGSNDNYQANCITKRIAVLGGSTTKDICDILELWLLDVGIKPIFYQSEYNKYYEDSVFGNTELDNFCPEIIIIFTTVRNVKNCVNFDEKEIAATYEYETKKLEMIWISLRKRYTCPIIQNNYERPQYRYMGNADITDPRGETYLVNHLNNFIYSYIGSHQDIYLNDMEYISSNYGLSRWFDEKVWCNYKYAMALEAIPLVSYSIFNIIKSIYGKNKKAIVLDLDNTLWGGVVGDDGVEGLKLGKETAEGESFNNFQSVLKKLHSMGVLLNICSKNDYENAIAGINHPDMLLKQEDFTIISANWEPKDVNVKKIIKMLNIGEDSVVFIDDNPMERDIVSKGLQSVSVPNVGNDPTQYPAYLLESGYFEITSLTKDDLQRTKMYEENARREQFQSSFDIYDDYLKSLEMIAEIKPFTDLHISRITQLINKTNQFNLTTKRVTADECEHYMNSGNHIALYGRLTDKFGDNGIVSIFVGRIVDNELHIEIFLMSCRVLKRNFERKLFEVVIGECKKRNIHTVFGYYWPTPKNKMVSMLYGDLGFSEISNDQGATTWKLDVENYSNSINYIELKNDDN